jgi:hypothetical protein
LREILAKSYEFNSAPSTTEHNDSVYKPLKPSFIGLGFLLIAIMITARAFILSAIRRFHQVVKYHSILAFSALPRTNVYIDYNRTALSDMAHAEVRSLQSKIPAGEQFVVWISQPSHLDYKRTPVFDVDPAG